MDCGPTCLRIISKFYGKRYSLQFLRGISAINKAGVSLLGLSQAAEKIGFQTQGVRISFEQLREIQLPCIAYWQQKHFVVVYEVKKNGKVLIADPVIGLINHSKEDFLDSWIGKEDGRQKGLALIMKPTPAFYEQEDDKVSKSNFSFFFKYLYIYKRLVIQLLVGLGVGSLLQLILPFLTQSIVDVGINTRNLNFIYVILIAQVMLFVGRTSVDFIRSWILLHISTRINISILTDFLIKLMKLPVSFFDTKMTGDILQRMNDQKRIESFLTGSTLNTVFSMFNFIIFGAVLAFYDRTVFIIFAASSILYALWIFLFLRRRRELDFKRFDVSAKNQSLVVQLITGMQEIKLNNCEQQKRWEWERLQTGLFRFSVKSLSLGQIQQAGSSFINEGKNILITFIVAKAVIEGQLTLGAMMAIQYVVGQLNSPIEQLVGFAQQLQDAKISIERLNEIHEMADEEPVGTEFINELPMDQGITLKNLSFSYPGAANNNVLSGIDIEIPQGKTTAIVGTSGSGKTTILKLLLRFYSPQSGDIKVGNMPLDNISFKMWRGLCGVVMQDGFIFSDTIAKNIAVGDEYPDINKLRHAIMVANITDFIENLPMGLNTKIGLEGNGISQGQRQRMLIARAVYKNPEYIFFDEATNALDANNEKVIMENLETFFRGRTVVVVAHRLSTVKNADNIIVLEKGRVIEQGTHAELSRNKGDYFRLVQNQLELGS
jgi:ATP-binding cassette subfamily B protein